MKNKYFITLFIWILLILSSFAYGQSDRGNLLLTGKITLEHQSNNGIAIAGFEDRLYIAWTGVNDLHNVNLAYSTDGESFPKKNHITLDESSGSAPYLTVFNEKLLLVWSDGGTQKIHVMHSPQTTKRKRYTVPKNASHSTIAAFPHNDSLVVAWRGEDRDSRPNLLISADGIKFTDNKKVVLEEDSSRYHLAGASFEDMLILCYTGVDSEQRLNLRYSKNDGASWESTQPMDNFSKSGPFILPYNDKLVMAFAGTNNKINIMYSKDGINFGYKTTFNTEETNHCPMLAEFNGKLYITWLGIDGKINIAQVEGL